MQGNLGLVFVNAEVNFVLSFQPKVTISPLGFKLFGPPSGVGSSQEKAKGGGTPLTAVLWELLLGPRNLPEAVQFLKGLMQEAPPMAGAAMLLMQPGHGACMVEWSPQQISVSPVAEGVLVHANHCISLHDAQSVKIAKLLEDGGRSTHGLITSSNQHL